MIVVIIIIVVVVLTILNLRKIIENMKNNGAILELVLRFYTPQHLFIQWAKKNMFKISVIFDQTKIQFLMSHNI